MKFAQFAPLAVILASTANSAPTDFRAGGRPGTHGMIAFGNSATGLFFSHIPMFQAPHDVQTVFAVDMNAKKQAFDDQNYTVLPKRFALDDVILGNVKQFTGSVYRGNFEAGGVELEQVKVVVKGMAVQAKRLVPEMQPSRDLTYAVVGKRYLVHVISHSKDFDQILVLDKDLDTPTVKVDAPNAVNNRLKPGDNVQGVRVLTELSLLVGPDFVEGPQ
jgi:hypothetical protein